MSSRWVVSFGSWIKQHRRVMGYGVAGLLVAVIAIQFAYPRNRLVPFTVRDGLAIGHWHKADAAWELNHRYQAVTVPIYFGDNQTPHRTVSLAQLGLTVDNQARLNHMDYPWYWRLLPSSLLWYHWLATDNDPQYQINQARQAALITDIAGKKCHVAPVNARLKAVDDTVTVVSAIPGGECQRQQVTQLIQSVTPRLNQSTTIRIPVTEKLPAISDQQAAAVAKSIMERVGDGVTIQAGGKQVIIPAATLYRWLTFSPDKATITATVSASKAKHFFDQKLAPLVYQAAGTTTITTRDFMEVSRQEGARGQALNATATAARLTAFLATGKSPQVQVSVTTPKVVYQRSYSSSNAGLSALMTHFAHNHPGTYGVALYELSGARRHASYNGDRSFVTASTYKLYVAYSTIKRVDAGTWHWSDANIAGGRNRSQCFDDMIVKSDNDCAVALLHAIGYTTITNEVHALGLAQTSFISDNTPHSTALDEARFLAQLETNQLPISASGRSKLLNAMKRQVYRQGIPAGVPASQVADKVGFLWGLLHDAAIVYSPKGTYVLVILTDNSSWATIAKLAQQIEALR